MSTFFLQIAIGVVAIFAAMVAVGFVWGFFEERKAHRKRIAQHVDFEKAAKHFKCHYCGVMVFSVVRMYVVAKTIEDATFFPGNEKYPPCRMDTICIPCFKSQLSG